MSEKEFQIGLVMAGAISAGAYTAGVADFLLQALEAWDKAKGGADKDSIPSHAARIRVLSGASAGSMTAAIIARALVTEIEPVVDVDHPPDTPDSNPARQTAQFKNPFYAAWVQCIDIRHLLDGKDLADDGAKVVSVLDSSVLPEIGNNVLRVNAGQRNARPDYVYDPMDLLLTTTNLRGVPYGFGLAGQQVGYRHLMTAYADHRRFTLRWPAAAAKFLGGVDSQSVPLDAALIAPSGGWATMMQTALASGAFPIGLAPRLLSRKATEYDVREWDVPEANPLKTKSSDPGKEWEDVPDDIPAQMNILTGPPPRALQAVPSSNEPIVPAWPDGVRASPAADSGADPSYVYDYWNVDGGTMNNEPLELARRILSGGGRNPRSGDTADRALIMIDPFPNSSSVTTDYDRKINLVQIVMNLFGALIEQARFKPDELVLAEREDVYSRFVVSPIYIDAHGRTATPAIASAVLGGFGGFLSESFRRHDFQLGRRNCQRFLERHFALPIENPLFADWRDKPFAANYKFQEKDKNGKLITHLPIIPLIGKDLRDEIPLPVRPRAAQVDLDQLAKDVRSRLDLILPRLIDDIPQTGLRYLLKTLWFAAKITGQRGKIVDLIMDKIKAELKPLA